MSKKLKHHAATAAMAITFVMGFTLIAGFLEGAL